MSQRTYWHLEPLGRRPTEYEIASSKLVYQGVRPFEIRGSAAHVRERASELGAVDWGTFRDPRQTTYARYTEIQRKSEAFVEGLIRSAEASEQDARLPRSWLATFSELLPPLRFPVHGLHMITAYVGQAAPTSEVIIACALSAADEVRRVQRLAYRMRELQRVEPSFGANAREAWQSEPRWQPLRETIERLLVTWDWGEAFVALAFALAPRFDELFTTWLGRLARQAGDDLSEKVFFSLAEDCLWHREWAAALLRVALGRPQNGPVVERWLARWDPMAEAAVRAFAPAFEAAGQPFAEVMEGITSVCDEQRRAACLGERKA